MTNLEEVAPSGGSFWHVEVTALESFARSLCACLGSTAAVATEVSTHLVGSDRAGHASHGVIRLPSYVQAADRGELVPSAEPAILKRSGATAVCDGNRGFGHYSTRVACDIAAGTAAQFGVGCVAVRHSGHIGRLGHYVETLAARGLASMVTVGMAGQGVGAMVLPGTASRFMGANPWAIGLPVFDGPPFVVDVSTAVIAEGKVQVALAEGRHVPPGCIVDKHGQPTEDPVEYFDGGGLLPLGGLLAGHKGFGLGLAAALLGSLATIDDEAVSMAGAPVRQGSDPRGRTAGVLVIVVDPAAFGDAQHYARGVAETLGALRREPGYGKTVVVPGEPEARARLASGQYLLLPTATRDDLEQLAIKYDLEFPE